MQFYAFQISFIGLSCIHMYIVFCIFKLVSYFFSSLIIEVTNWSFCIHLCFRYFFLEFLIFRLTLIIVFVMLKLHDFLSLLKKISLFKNQYESFGFCIQLQTTYIMDGDGMILFYCSYFLWAVISQQFIIPQRNLLPEYN